MPKGFTEEEKGMILKKLLEACKESWQTYGYKKTSLDDLCMEAGISKGSFYSFFDSKEAIFYQVHKNTLKRMYEQLEKCLEKRPDKYGIADALKMIYKEYSKSSFMYDIKNPDYRSYFNKIQPEQRKEIMYYSYQKAKSALDKPFLSLKVSEDMALSLISVMLSTVSFKNDVLIDSSEIFDFMIDHLIDDIFE